MNKLQLALWKLSKKVVPKPIRVFFIMGLERHLPFHNLLYYLFLKFFINRKKAEKYMLKGFNKAVRKGKAHVHRITIDTELLKVAKYRQLAERYYLQPSDFRDC